MSLPVNQKLSIAYLLPLWGEKYIEKFFEIVLPTFLAPGNFPAMHYDFKCHFLFLTKKEEVNAIRLQKKFKELSACCQIEFIDISDLIFDQCPGIHNVTVALAYERGVRSRKEEMFSTYFFFLISDCIVPDHAFQNIKKYLYQGVSGITLGAFRVSEERFTPILKRAIERQESGILALEAREWIELALPHLHPHTLAETVTEPSTHVAYANRLFWRVDEKTLIGRFFTRHMLCIKPEVADYVIGAPCDYSFMVEMSPSRNWAHIQDSDEFCMIEIAADSHDQHFIRQGDFDFGRLSCELSGLLSQVQRENAYFPVIYHAEHIPETIHESLLKSEGMIRSLEQKFISQPQPVRGNACWDGALDYILKHLLQVKEIKKYYSLEHKTFGGIIGSQTFAPTWRSSKSQQLDDRILLKLSEEVEAAVPHKKLKRFLWDFFVARYPAQNRFSNSELVESLTGHFKQHQRSVTLLIAFEPFSELSSWIEAQDEDPCLCFLYDFFAARSDEDLAARCARVNSTFILLTDKHLHHLGPALQRCTGFLPSHATLTVFLQHKKWMLKKSLQKKLLELNQQLNKQGICCESFRSRTRYFGTYFSYLQHQSAKNLFYPKKAFGQRVAGYAGLLLCYFGLSCLHLLKYIGVNASQQEGYSFLKYKKSGKEDWPVKQRLGENRRSSLNA